MKRLYANNCRTTLASAAAPSDTTLTLASGAGWPSPGAGEANYATLDDGAGHVEIVDVTARSGATVTVTRAQQGTTARTWAIGTTVDLRWTAEDGASRVWTGSAPALAVDGDIAVDSVTGVLWYRLSGSTLRAARAPTAGSTITDGLATFDGSNGGQLKAQTAWRVVGNARLEPTSSACELALPTLPVLTPTAGTAGRVWLDTATGELVSDDGAALLRYAPGGGTVDLQSAYAGGSNLDVDDLDVVVTLSAADWRVDGPGSVLLGVGSELDRWWLATTGSVEIVAGDGYELTVTGAYVVVSDTVAITGDSVVITSTSPTSVVGGLAVTGALTGSSTIAATGQVSGSRFAGPVWLPDTNASHSLILAAGSDLTANRTLTITTGDASRTLQLDANVSISSWAAGLLDDADASAARATLVLGSIATQDASSVSVTGGTITGITDLAVADGGTGASTPAGARTNLGLGRVTLSSDASNSSGTTYAAAGFAFAPSASKTYHIHGAVWVTTASGGTGIQPYLGTSTTPGGTGGSGASMLQTCGNNVITLAMRTQAWASANTVNGLASETGGILVVVDAIVTTTGSPPSVIDLYFRSEVDTSQVTCKAGSTLYFEEVA